MAGTEIDTQILTGCRPLAGEAEEEDRKKKSWYLERPQLMFLDAGRTAQTLQEKRKYYSHLQGICT